MSFERVSGKIYAPRPGMPTMIRSDIRSDEARQQDRTNSAEIYEGLCMLAREADGRFVAAKEGFHRLPERDQQYLRALLHRSARLCLLLSQGNWTKAGVVLTNLARSTPDPVYSREIADRLGYLEENGLEDRRTCAETGQIAA